MRINNKKTVLWLLIALGAVAFLVYRTDREAFKDAISDINIKWAFAGVGLYFLAQTLLAPRWVQLLKVQGVNISVFQAIKLTYLGLFYNNMMPGAVGGDLLKGWYITHHSEKHQRVEAAVSVFVDRMVGLTGLVLVGVIASFFVGGALSIPIGPRLVEVRVLILLIFFVMMAVIVVFMSRRIRRTLLLDRLLAILPFSRQLRKVDDAIRIYRRHGGTLVIALLLTAVIQGLSILAVWALTRSLYLTEVTFLECLIILPIVWMVGGIIPVPGGLGVIENLFIPFYASAIDPPSGSVVAAGQAAALALLYRMMFCVCSAPGALVPLFGGHLPKASELERAMQDNEEEGGKKL